MIKTKGRSCLKISSVVFLLYGAALLLSIVLSLFSKEAMEEYGLLDRLNSPVPILAVALFISIPVLYLFAGFLGLLRADRPRKAKPCLWLGIPIFLITAADIVLTAITYGAPDLVTVCTYLLDIFVPTLYLVGVWRNMHHVDPPRPADETAEQPS